MIYVLSIAKMASINILTFKVSRKNPELVHPAEPTPYEFIYLSDVDNKNVFRFQAPLIHFFPKSLSMEGKDPVSVTRDAIAKALVFYYPLAGRLREYVGRKLAVECTGEGVGFVEADADVTLHQFGDTLYPPFPNLEELLLDIPNSNGLVNCPILFFQVTRLKCGGFILGCRFNHAMFDGAGIFQFLNTVGELARGATVPSIPPVWQRHLLTARSPAPHDMVPASDTNCMVKTDEMVQRAFFFSSSDISALRHSLPPHLQTCSKFVVLAVFIWRCRAISLSLKPDEEVVFACTVDIRKRMKPPLPVGYYGNALVFMRAVTSAKELSEYPLQYAVELVMNAKDKMTHEHIEGLIGMTEDLSSPWERIYVVSDLTYVNGALVDLGWGTPAYGGVAKSVIDWTPVEVNWYIPFKDEKGEQGKMVPLCLPLNAMEIFAAQLKMMMTDARTSSGSISHI